MLAALRETPAKYFDLEESGPGKFECTTRDNGDVGEEEPGEEDIKSAHEACKQLKLKFPEAKISWETVDEWTEILIEFKVIPKYSHPETLEELQKIAHEISQKLQARGLTTVVAEPMVAPRLDRASIRIETNGMLLQHNIFQDPEGQMNLSLKLESSGENPQKLLLVGHPFQGKSINWEGTATELSNQLWEGWLQDLEAHRTEIINSLWKDEPFSTDIPNGAVLVAKLGYDSPWKNCPFYRLPDGNYLLVDGEEERRLLIAKENFLISTRLLGDFFPETPEGCVTLKEISDAISEEITKRIVDEAKENNTTTLKKFGHKGSIFKAEDGSIHFLPTRETTFGPTDYNKSEPSQATNIQKHPNLPR